MNVDVMLAILGGIIGATVGQLGGNLIIDRFANPLYQKVQRRLTAARASRPAGDTYD